ncbi:MULTISPECIES: hypothetical protein [unclassified Streptomyces]|uniref:hypothetical protein n=1 Tax=unclassified Streptomyces TaxID=2593676 RepID=UPI0036E6D0B0
MPKAYVFTRYGGPETEVLIEAFGPPVVRCADPAPPSRPRTTRKPAGGLSLAGALSLAAAATGPAIEGAA